MSLMLQSPSPAFLVRCERWGVPVLHRDQAALERFRLRASAERVDGRVAHRAMAEALDKIGAAVPFAGLGGIRLELARGKIQRAPAEDQRAIVVGKTKIVRAVGGSHRTDRHQVGEDRVAVLARDLRVRAEWHRRVEQSAVRVASGVERPVELVRRPGTDSGLGIGRDVRGVERAERRRHRAPAGEKRLFRRGVAGDAIAGPGEIFAARDERGIRRDRGRRGRD